jgi:hypothetical protein
MVTNTFEFAVDLYPLMVVLDSEAASKAVRGLVE